MRTLTIALTHFDRANMLIEAIERVIGDPRVEEVVICDDQSGIGQYNGLCDFYRNHPKVFLFRNEKNLDCYANKAKAVEHCKGKWVILFDSDNILDTDYLDTLYSIPVWEEDTIYAPDFAKPHFDYTRFSGKLITADNVSVLMGREEIAQFVFKHRLIRQPRLPEAAGKFRCALNTCNFFVHRDRYLDVWDGTVDPHTADTIYHNYNWLRAGRKILIANGLRYHHRIHEGSHYKQNRHKTGDFLKEVETKLMNLPSYEKRNGDSENLRPNGEFPLSGRSGDGLCVEKRAGIFPPEPNHKS